MFLCWSHDTVTQSLKKALMVNQQTHLRIWILKTQLETFTRHIKRKIEMI